MHHRNQVSACCRRHYEHNEAYLEAAVPCRPVRIFEVLRFGIKLSGQEHKNFSQEVGNCCKWEAESAPARAGLILVGGGCGIALVVVNFFATMIRASEAASWTDEEAAWAAALATTHLRLLVSIERFNLQMPARGGTQVEPTLMPRHDASMNMVK